MSSSQQPPLRISDVFGSTNLMLPPPNVSMQERSASSIRMQTTGLSGAASPLRFSNTAASNLASDTGGFPGETGGCWRGNRGFLGERAGGGEGFRVRLEGAGGGREGSSLTAGRIVPGALMEGRGIFGRLAEV